MKPITQFPALFAALFLTSFFLNTSNLTAQSCEHPDVPALDSLYHATDGPNWYQQNGWTDEDCSPCERYGVSCDADGRVTSLTLRGNGLAGALPTELGNLPYLRFIQLGYNELSGAIPASLFTIDSLRYVYLGGNQLSGELPNTLGQTPELEWLVLGGNQLTGSVPQSVTNLLRLEVIDLTNNQFNGAIPEGLGDMPLLTSIQLSNNQLEGCFPADLAAICATASVNTSGNVGLAWMGDFSAFCDDGLTTDQEGAPCNDGNESTIGDVITASCGCSGVADPNGLSEGGDGESYNDEEAEVNGRGLTTTGRTTVPNNTQANLTNAPEVYGELSVYPNPLTGNQLTVKGNFAEQPTTLTIRSLSGQVVGQWSVNEAAVQLSLPSLKAGLYLVESTTDQGRQVSRLIIQ